MNLNKVWMLLFLCATLIFSSAQKNITSTNKGNTTQALTVFFDRISSLCTHPNDNELKQLLADNLKNNKTFLKEWEIGLNNTDAQIWQALSRLIKAPYIIDSSNKTKIVCTVPKIKDGNKVPNSLGKLVILSADNLSDGKDVIYSQPNEKGKPIGKVKPGEQYRYFVGTAAYSASMKQYLTDGFDYNGEGDIGYFAIELDAQKHKLGYISTNATSACLPVMQLQYTQGIWKITKLSTD